RNRSRSVQRFRHYGKVAHDLGREYIGIELNPAYAEASEKRIGAHIQQTLNKTLDEVSDE
ncbi:MAG: hypothetical protein PHG64_15445, partial [Paludibacter sp.]|nr:hypothetical protein [Paludibacter sp.]